VPLKKTEPGAEPKSRRKPKKEVKAKPASRAKKDTKKTASKKAKPKKAPELKKIEPCFKEDLILPEVNIGTIGHVAHGKSTLIHQLTGKWTQEHSEEIKRGLTIRLGYADFPIRKCLKCKEPDCYTTKEKCPNDGSETKIIRKATFVDSPGHETLMATMLTGAATMDGAILVIAANETCPQPQTREHLLALEISGIKNIVVVQNKIDLVSPEQAKENYSQIKKFLKGTVAETAPIIPVSAQYGANIDYLLNAIEKTIPTPKRDLSKNPIFLIARSFDINKPGTFGEHIIGGVLGGILKEGKLKIGDKIEILPGLKKKHEHKVEWQPISSKVTSVTIGNLSVDNLVPGGSGGIGTELDPFLTKSDALVGQVLGIKDKMPPVWSTMNLKVKLLERAVGTKDELKIEPLKVNEPLMINAWTCRSVGIVTKSYGNEVSMTLKRPVCIHKGERIVLSRQMGQKWRLVGYGELI